MTPYRAETRAAKTRHAPRIWAVRGICTQFIALPPPSTEDVEGLIVDVADRCERWLRRAGYGDEDAPAEPDEEQDGLSTIQARSLEGRAALGRVRRVQRRGGREYQMPPRCASSRGYSLHAGVAAGAQDRAGLERLARYISRGPVAKGRLSRAEDGDVVLHMKRAWSDGTTEIRFTPLAFVERLASLVPPPRVHQVLYHGALAPHAAWRARVVPSPRSRSDTAAGDEDGDEPTDAAEPPQPALSAQPHPKSRWVPWARLLWRVFGVAGFECPNCGGPMHLRALVARPPATVKVLNSLRRSAQRARPPP